MDRRENERVFKKIFIANAFSLLIMALGWVYLLGQLSNTVANNTKNTENNTKMILLLQSAIDKKMDEPEVKDFVDRSIKPIQKTMDNMYEVQVRMNDNITKLNGYFIKEYGK